MIRPHSQSKTVGALLSLLYRKKERPPPVADVSMWRRPFLLMGSPKGDQMMLLLVVLKTLVEELDVARDVLLIDEATRERLTLVIDRHVERLCEVVIALPKSFSAAKVSFCFKSTSPRIK